MMSRLATVAVAALCIAGASATIAAPKKKQDDATPPATAAPTTPAPAAVYPSAIDPKYAKESPGKGREHTCLDQYNANKANNANGGMVWIQKGGGYYSLCNKHLKAAAAPPAKK